VVRLLAIERRQDPHIVGLPECRAGGTQGLTAGRHFDTLPKYNLQVRRCQTHTTSTVHTKAKEDIPVLLLCETGDLLHVAAMSLVMSVVVRVGMRQSCSLALFLAVAIGSRGCTQTKLLI